MRRTAKARDAFVAGSVESSKLVHQKTQLCEQGHRSNSIDSLDELLGLSGRAIAQALLISIIIIYSNGTTISPGLINTVCFVAGALGVYNSVITFLSRMAQSKVESFERARETWEFKNFAEGEKKEMVDLYISKGVAREDAVKVIDLLAKPKYTDAFVDLMMVEELGILPAPRRLEALRESCVSLCASVAGGVLPLIPHFLGYHVEFNQLLVGAAVASFISGALISRSTIDDAFVAGFTTLTLLSLIFCTGSFLISQL